MKRGAAMWLVGLACAGIGFAVQGHTSFCGVIFIAMVATALVYG